MVTDTQELTPELKVAFSGTATLLPKQEAFVRATVLELLQKLQQRLPDTVRATVITGACIGVDAVIAEVAYLAGFYVHTFVPANLSKVDLRWPMHCSAYTQVANGREPYRLRNQAMVDAADFLVAFPGTPEKWPDGSLSREGTWMTVRMADKANKIDRSSSIFKLWEL